MGSLDRGGKLQVQCLEVKRWGGARGLWVNVGNSKWWHHGRRAREEPSAQAVDVHTCTEEVLVVLGDWY